MGRSNALNENVPIVLTTPWRIKYQYQGLKLANINTDCFLVFNFFFLNVSYSVTPHSLLDPHEHKAYIIPAVCTFGQIARLMDTKKLYKHSHYELQHIPAMVYKVYIWYDREENEIIRIKVEYRNRKLETSLL